MHTPGPWINRRTAAAMLAAATCHFALATAALFVSSSASLAAFDRGGEASPIGRAAGMLLRILLLPVGQATSLLAPAGTGRMWGSLLFAANSLLWGLVIGAVIRWAGARGPRAAAAARQ